MQICKLVINGKEVVRTATPADDMMQAFAYKHLVPAEDLQIVVLDWSRGRKESDPETKRRKMQTAAQRRSFKSPMTLLGDKPVKIPAGGTTELRVIMPLSSNSGPVQIELSDPPEGLGIDQVSRFDEGVAILLRCDAEKAKPGLKGNLIANASQQRRWTDKGGKTREYRSVMGALPAIPFEVVPSEPAP
jgi:hypothetical protein